MLFACCRKASDAFSCFISSFKLLRTDPARDKTAFDETLHLVISSWKVVWLRQLASNSSVRTEKAEKALILGCDSVLVVLSLLAVLNLFANLVTPVFKLEKNMAEIRLTTDTVDLRVDLLALSAPDLLPPWELVWTNSGIVQLVCSGDSTDSESQETWADTDGLCWVAKSWVFWCVEGLGSSIGQKKIEEIPWKLAPSWRNPCVHWRTLDVLDRYCHRRSS